MAMKNSIEFSKEEYLTIIQAVQIAGSVYGIMGDMVNKKFKKIAHSIDNIEDLILSHADKFGTDYLVEEFMGKKLVCEEKLQEYLDDLWQYEEYVMWDNLAHRLARRDMGRIYSKQQLSEMDRYKYIELESTLEEGYEKEFQQNGLERVEISTMNSHAKH